MTDIERLKQFYANKRVLVTGHTGFKGSWLCMILSLLGSTIYGYALESQKDSLYDLLDIDRNVANSYIGDVRDVGRLKKIFNEAKPQVVFHLAAQPIVRESYKNPQYTFETNIMGTVNVLECIRTSDSVKSFINVTTDKVYRNKEWEWGYRENEELNGIDPYSNSKSCSELVTSSYKESFFYDQPVAISTMRAGNVIGGGDFAVDRIIPDCVRAVSIGKTIIVRNPKAIRPYQHVLEPLSAYLLVAAEQYYNKALEGAYNIGPNNDNCIETQTLVELFCKYWNKNNTENAGWKEKCNEGPKEANFLRLDSSRIYKTFGWEPLWTVEKAIEKVVLWEKERLNAGNMRDVTFGQINEYFGI